MGSRRQSRVTRLALAGLIMAVAATGVRAQSWPLTGAEQADWERHTTHEELAEFLFAVQARTDKMLIRELTETAQGRTVYLVMLGDPPTATPGTAWFSGKPTILLVQNVHGGELSGREGGLQLIRELALGELQPLLSDLNVLVIPSINPDGANRRPRPSRTNALGYDMNRDYVALETPESSAVVEDVLLEWWPDVHLDSHNGGARPYNLTYQSTLHPAADPDLVALANGPMFEAVKAHMEAEGLLFFFYSGPRTNPETGEHEWRTTDPLLRKQHSYSGFQNMIALLYECPGGDLELQARSQREGQEALLRFVADHAGDIRSTIMQARRRTLSREPAEVVVGWEQSTYPGTVEFYVRDRQSGESQLVEGTLATRYVPSDTRVRPWAYAFDGSLHKIAAHLRRHAIEVERLQAPVSVEVEEYRVLSAEYATRPYQNHLMLSVEVEVVTEHIELPAGTYVVRLGQNGGTTAAYLLEPDTDDSLTAWNFLDHMGMSGPREFRGEQRPGTTLPIWRIMAPVGIRSLILP